MTYDSDPIDIRLMISIGLGVVRRPCWNRFAGKGVRRRRELDDARTLAASAAETLHRPYTFADASGHVATVEELAAVIKAALLEVPLEVILRRLGVDTLTSRAAHKEITEACAVALEQTYTVADACKPKRVGLWDPQ